MTCEIGSSEAALLAVATGGASGVYPLVEAQYWTSKDEPLSVFRCTNELYCPGGDPAACAKNAIGQACSMCKEEYYWSGNGCTECSDADKSKAIFPVLPSFVLFVVVLGLYKFSGDTYEKWNSWQNACIALGFIAVNHYQLISLVQSANIPKPTLISDFFSFWSFTEDVLSMFNLECAGFASFTVSMVLKALSPMGLLMVCIILYMSSQLLERFSNIGIPAMSFDRTWNVFFSLIFTFFNGIAAMAMSLFKCAASPNGKMTLSRDPGINCFEGEWNNLLVVGILAFLIYCVFCGVVFSWAIWNATRTGYFVEERFRMRWKFLFIKFRPDVHWWAIVLLVRGVCINASFVVFANGLEQLYWIMVVESCYMLLTVVYHPWRFRKANYLALATSFSILYACSLSAIFVEDNIEILWVSQMTVSITLVPLLAALTFVAMTIQVVWNAHAQDSTRPRVALEQVVAASQAIVDMDKRLLEEVYSAIGEWDQWYLEKSAEVVLTCFLKKWSSSRTMSIIAENSPSALGEQAGVKQKSEENDLVFV
jgi:hypothetical protein